MIPLMSLMIGAYIVTKMMIFLLRDDPQHYKFGIVINKLLATITIIVTIVCVILIFLPTMKSLDVDNILKTGELLSKNEMAEEPKEYLIITKPAEFYRDDFKSLWMRERITVGTKLEVIYNYLWRSSVTDLKIVFYRVKYKGTYGWIMEDHCKIVNE